MECIQYIDDNSIFNTLPQYSYTTMLDEEEVGVDFGWNKDTVRFVIDNADKIKATVRRELKQKFKYINDMEVEEVYDKIIEYVYKYDDYDIDKARRDSLLTNSTTIRPIEAYVFGSAVKNCIKRFIKDYGKERCNRASNYVTIKDKEVSVIDRVADSTSEKEYEQVEDSLEAALKIMECKRYRYGSDIFLIMYLRLRAENEESFARLINIIGITTKILNIAERKARLDGDFMYLMKMMIDYNKEKMASVIRNYVYSASLLDSAIDMMNELSVKHR